MATLSAPPTPNLNGGLMIDPTKQAEYPILLGGRLTGKDTSKDTKFVNLTYNYKSKSTSSQQKAIITPGDSQDLYKLTIENKAGNAEQTNLKYVYNGSVDPDSLTSDEPAESRNLILVYDAKQKAFVLEPVSTKLNFNLRSAPGKSDQQVSDQYPRLNTLSSTHLGSEGIQQDGANGSESEDAGEADEDNPYDFRHFLPKAKNKEDKPGDGASPSPSSTPDSHQTSVKTLNNSRAVPPASTGRLKPEQRPAPKRKQQTNPLRQQKKTTKPVSRGDTKPTASVAKTSREKAKEKDQAQLSAPAPVAAPAEEPPTVIESIEPTSAIDFFPSDEESKPRPAASPSSNIIVDGDLIIDMGSPPPQRPAFKINPRHFASNNTSANEAGYGSDDEEDELDDHRSPSPEGPASADEDDEDRPMDDVIVAEKSQEAAEDPADFEDDLVAEMEAALEESAREEEENRARLQQQQQQHQYQRHVESEDESEVSEEE